MWVGCSKVNPGDGFRHVEGSCEDKDRAAAGGGGAGDI